MRGGGERPAAQPLDVADLIDAASRRWEGPAEQSDHELRVEPGPPSVVAASAEDLAAILDNLTENALDLLAAGTTVTLTWESDGKAVRLAVLDEAPASTRTSRSASSSASTAIGEARARRGPGSASRWSRSLAARWAARSRSRTGPRAAPAPRSPSTLCGLYRELTLPLTKP